MSHFKEYNSSQTAPDGRSLGDEWAGWDGEDGGTVSAGRELFLSLSISVVILLSVALCIFVYLIVPRISLWNERLPDIVWFAAIILIFLSIIWVVLFLATILVGKNFLLSKKLAFAFFDLVFVRAFRIAGWLGLSRDGVGHSFVLVSNSLARAMRTETRETKLLLLLPRCLSKEELKGINDLKEKYPLEVHTVSGGELARKKVKEIKPTAVIGVACERDLVSGIRDVGGKISVIGIPNLRPEGPCKNTQINMNDLIEAIEFYVGRR